MGGITASGGEPLMQMEFLTALFSQAKKRGIHTCLDTSGILYREARQQQFDELFAHLDLVLLDIKHSDGKGHRDLTGQELEPVLSFGKALERARIPMIVRHVALPGITDKKEVLRELGKILASYENLAGLEVLPYHTMGIGKYEALGIPYPLEGVKEMSREEGRRVRQQILEGILEEKENQKKEKGRAGR